MRGSEEPTINTDTTTMTYPVPQYEQVYFLERPSAVISSFVATSISDVVLSFPLQKVGVIFI
jgi:hypothetical protein